jgi:hypothetical protein
MGINTMCRLKRHLRSALSRRFGRVASLLVLALATQRGALGRHDWPTVAQKQKGPPRQCRAGQEGGVECYWLMR